MKNTFYITLAKYWYQSIKINKNILYTEEGWKRELQNREYNMWRCLFVAAEAGEI